MKSNIGENNKQKRAK